MNWIDLPIEQRQQDVSIVDDLIESESPDRFWLSKDQDGEDTQEMRIQLPYGTDILYQVHVMTAQLKVLRLLAPEYGWCSTSELNQEMLDRVGILREEQFEVSPQCPNGIRYEVVLDVPGLTHVVLDNLLDDFLRRGGIPAQPRPINPLNLVKRLMKAECEGKLADYYRV